MIYKLKALLFFIIVFCSLLFFVKISTAQAADPVLFFSDLDWGPKTGWEGSATKGAAVSIWGKNFGTTRGSNYVTVNGAQITEYAEWGATGPARGSERITFWLNSSCADGSGTISITVNGVTSNTLPFTITNGTIYFISISAGNNSNNGLYSSSQGGSNGPFRDLWKFNPCGPTDSQHTTGSCNPSQDGQYIAYVRGGTYTTEDSVDDTFIALRGPYGGPTKRKALIGYPGEASIINTANASRGIVWNASYSPYGFNSYFTFAKLTGINGSIPMGSFGSYNRFVGNTFQDYLTYEQAGIIQVTDSKYTSIYGNLFDHNGNDSMKHNIYIKTENTGMPSGTDLSTLYTYVGWNEFSNAVSSDAHGGVVFLSKEGSSVAAPYPTDYIYIHDNYFHDGNMDFIYSGDNVDLGNNIYIYNNIFKGSTSSNGGITIYAGTKNIYYYNNTFYQIGATNQSMAWQTGNSHSYWKNNIWYMGGGQATFNLETYQGATANFENDLFYNGSVPSGGSITISGSRTGNPLLTNPAGGDCTLQSGSPAIDAGTSAVSSIVTRDYVNISRPQGVAYDIGAYEYVSGTPVSDTQAPTTPTNLSATAISSSQINLSWTASTDNVGVTGYRIYRGGTQIGTAATNSYSNTGLSPSTSYSYTVAAYDAAGNVSGQSASASATTQAGTTKRGDLNNDGRVDVIDLGIFLSNWGSTSRPPADINQDGHVDVIDLGILLSNWG